LVELELEWPIEVVRCQAEVVTPRELTSLEWVIERILDEFGDAPPSLDITATELGIKDPVFFIETMESLLQLGAIEILDKSSPVDLSNVRLTPRGNELFRQGRIDGIPARKGLIFHFDALTIEHIVKPPKNVQSEAQDPIIEGDELPQRPEHIGLDRARELSVAQGEPYHQGASQIRRVEVDWNEGGHLWTKVRISVGLDRKGTLKTEIRGFGNQQETWLEQNVHDLPFLLRLGQETRTIFYANNGSDEGRCQDKHGSGLDGLVTDKEASSWIFDVEQVISPSEVIKNVSRVIQLAQSEVILHGFLVKLPKVGDQLTSAAKRGVRCYICGGQPAGIAYWTEREETGPGFVVTTGEMEHSRPVAVVADSKDAVTIDSVVAKTPQGKEIRLTLAAVLKYPQIPHIRLGLLAKISDALLDKSLRFDFAAFALTGKHELWRHVIQNLWHSEKGLERIRAIKKAANWAKAVVGASSFGKWSEEAERAWWEVFDGTINKELEGGTVDLLLSEAVGLINPATILSRALKKLVIAQPAIKNTSSLNDIQRISKAISAYWLEWDPITSCSTYTSLLERCLVVPRGISLRKIPEASALVKKTVSVEQAARWVENVWNRLSTPKTLKKFRAWAQLILPLLEFTGTNLREEAREIWTRLANDVLTKSQNIKKMTECLKAAEGLFPPADAVGDLLTFPSDNKYSYKIKRILLVREAVRTLWPMKRSLDRKTIWARTLKEVLDVPEGGFNMRVHGEDVSEGIELLCEYEEFWSERDVWAEALSSSLTVPHSISELTQWLKAHYPLASTTGTWFRERVEEYVKAITGRPDEEGGSEQLRQSLAQAWETMQLPPQGLDILTKG